MLEIVSDLRVRLEVKDTIIWLVSGGFRWFHVVSGWFEVVSAGFLWFQIISGGFRWFQAVPRFSKYASLK